MERLTGMSHFFSEDEMDCHPSTSDIGDKSDNDIQQQKTMADKKVSNTSLDIQFIGKDLEKFHTSLHKKKAVQNLSSLHPVSTQG